MVTTQQLSFMHRLMRGRQNVYTSTLLRQHGYQYKVAFGCSLPDIKSIAQRIKEGLDDSESLLFGLAPIEVAEVLWADVAIRESLMVAPLLYPRGEMSVETAERWALQIPTPEVADVVCMYAFQYGIGLQLIELWQQRTEPMLLYCVQNLKRRLL